MEPVRTHRSSVVVEAARLHRSRHRRERGHTLVEGPRILADAAASGVVIVRVFHTEPGEDHAVIAVDERALARLAGTKTPRGPVAVVEIPEDSLERGRNLLVSAGVSDPGNVGTMIRTAAALGWGYAYLEGSADPWAPKTIRAGAGGQFQTPVSRVGHIDELSSWAIVASVARGGVAPDEIRDRPIALLIGEEAHGLPAHMMESADHRLTIPMSGVTESLNAAVAAGIAMYALSKPGGRAGGEV